MIPLVLLAVFVTVGGVFAYQTRSAFKEVQSVSTPPPEVSGSALGLEEDVAIDTGPAQEAILERQQRETGQTTDATQTPTSSSTEAPANAGDSDSSTGTEEAPNTTAETPSADGDSSSDATDQDATEDATQETSGERSNTTSSIPPDGTPEEGETNGPAALSTPDGTPSQGTPTALEVPDNGTPPSVMSADPPEVVETDGITVLLMGVDARDGESIDIGVRPDSLAVLHIDRGTGDCRMLAIPRDSRATLPGYGQSKINHALAVGGIPYEMLVVEEYLGIELDNYVLVDFAGVETVVDELGGITVDNPEAFEMEGQTFAAGTLELDGERALLYARFRGDSDGDFGRISRQQQVLRALMNEAADVNLVKLVPNMFSLMSDHFRTDYGMTDLIDLANTYRTSCSAESIETDTIPGDVSMERDDLMQMDLSFVVSDPKIVEETVSWLLMQDDPTDEINEERTHIFTARREEDSIGITRARNMIHAGRRQGRV